MPVPSSLKSSLSACEKVVKAVRASPALLDQPELAFLKRFVDGDVEEVESEEEEEAAAPAKKEEEPALKIPKNAAEAPDDADWSLSSSAKSAASEAQNSGDLKTALKKWTEALEAEAATASLSAATLAKRAECLLKLGRPVAAVSDATAALGMNPDSARAFKVRGKARASLEEFTGANLDFASAQQLDFDPDLATLCKEVKEKASLEAAGKREAEREAELAKRKAKAAAQRRAEQEAEAAAARSAGPPGGMPGGMGGMPGGMGGMPGMGGMGGGMPGMGGGMPGGGGGMPPGMAGMMNDPSMQEAMQNPKVMAALQEIISGGAPDPAKLMKYMSDPEVGPALQKMMGAMGGGGMGGMGGMPGMGGMGGMPGGMGGMPGGMGGMPGGGMGGGYDDDDDDDDDDMPDLEEVDEVD